MANNQPNSIQVLLLPQEAKDSALIDIVLKSPQSTVLKQQIISLIVKLWKEFQSIQQAIFTILKTLENTKRLEAELVAAETQPSTAEKNAEINAEMLRARLVQIQAEISKLENALTKEVTKYKSLSELRDAILAKDPSQGVYETLGAQTKADVAAGAVQMLAKMSPALTKTLSDKGITQEKLVEEITTTVPQPKETILQIEKRVAESREQYNKTQPADKQTTDPRTLRDILIHRGFIYEMEIGFALRRVLKLHFGALSTRELNKLVKDFFSGMDMHSHVNRMEADIKSAAQIILVEFTYVMVQLNQSEQRMNNMQSQADDLYNQLKGLRAQSTTVTADPLNSHFSKVQDEEAPRRSPFATPKLNPSRGGAKAD